MISAVNVGIIILSTQLRAMPRKVRDFKNELISLGFVQRRGKGSHKNWRHPQLQLLITIAFKDGDDTPLYLEKLLKKAIQELEKIAEEGSDS